MKKISTEVLNIDFSLDENLDSLPKNIYAIKVHNIDNNSFFKIAVNHDGYCPNISGGYQESNFLDYLSNLEFELIEEFFKSTKTKKPEYYRTILEIITDKEGKLYRLSKAVS